MKSLWNDADALSFSGTPLDLRVYTSRLLGSDPDLVLSGGGNTSVKMEMKNIYGDTEPVLFIKGSGNRLETIDKRGFSPVRIKDLLRMETLGDVPDTVLQTLYRSALTDPRAPDPSIESVVHAVIPFTFVDHTHADAVVTITNTRLDEGKIQELFGETVAILPYIKAGLPLAKKVRELVEHSDMERLEGIILCNHGLITFGDDAETSYRRMIRIVNRAEEILRKNRSISVSPRVAETPEANLGEIAHIRRLLSEKKGTAMIARLNRDPETRAFLSNPDAVSLVGKGVLTPDHAIRTGPFPAIFTGNPSEDIERFQQKYAAYVTRNGGEVTDTIDCLPRWAILRDGSVIGFGRELREAETVLSIASHLIRAVALGEGFAGWNPLPEKEMFAMEFRDFQQAKMKKKDGYPIFAGKTAIVTGAASGIGLACAKKLKQLGAQVVGIDINPDVCTLIETPESLDVVCDITDYRTVQSTVEGMVRFFGGLDILVSNAGIFTPGLPIEQMDPDAWNRSMEINLSSHQRLLTICIPYLKLGIDPAVIFIGSKNVPAPGPGAAAYSVAKAGLTQLSRIAALELGKDNIRVNVVHPNAVYDTALWTPEVLESRAASYGLSVDAYKKNNLLKTEVTSDDVAELVCAMAGPAFLKTTGAQVPIDGGNDRVI